MHTETVTRDGAVICQIENIGKVELTVFFDASVNFWFWSVEEVLRLDPNCVSGPGELDFDSALKEGRQAARGMCAEVGIDVPDAWGAFSEASRTQAVK